MNVVRVKRKPRERVPSASDRLLHEIGATAYHSANALWRAVLDTVEDMDRLRGLVKGFHHLKAHGDYLSALDMLRALYDLVGEDVPDNIERYAQNHALLCLFIDEFTAETEEQVMDWEFQAAAELADVWDDIAE